METVFRITLIAVGLVNAYPLVAAFAPDMLSSLYGLQVTDANLLILLRHRAILFGLLGSLLMAAAFDSRLYTAAVIAGVVSMLAYILIAWQTGGYNANIGRVVIIDIVASVALLVTYALYRVTIGSAPNPQ